MSRPKGRWVNSSSRVANIRRSTTAVRKELLLQKKLGNLNKEGEYYLKNSQELTYFVGHSYDPGNNDEYKDNRTQKIVAWNFTKTGTVAKKKVSKSGKQYISYGKDIKSLYKSAKAKKVESATQERFDFDQQGNKVKINKTYNYEYDDIEEFVGSLEGTGSLIALRIAMGQNRSDVLKDYGY